MKTTVGFCLILLFQCPALRGQNLVRNPGFEAYNGCQYFVPGPDGFPVNIAYSPSYDSFPTVIDWVAPLQINTPDYFNICDTTPFGHGIPTNGLGFQAAHRGSAYAGMLLYLRQRTVWNDYREYIEGKLLQPMQAGHQYYIGFSVSLAVAHIPLLYGTVVTTDNMGAYISDTMVLDSMGWSTAYLTKPVTVRNPPGKYITDTAGWTKVEGTYTAHGGEQWITLGHFNDGLPMQDSVMFTIRDSVYSNDSFVYCYVYIDDVCVMDISDSSLHTRDTSLCAAAFPQTLNSVVTGERYEWSTGAATAAIAVNKPGKYWRLTTGECFYFTDTFRVQGKPVFHLGNDTSVCREIPLALGSPLYDNRYQWSTGDTTCCILATMPGTYALTISNYCGITTHDVQITGISPCDNCLLLPNAFTPNGDGINDLYLPQVRCQLQYYRLRIYNRYGQMIFETTNPADGWDGQFKGQPQGVGVYYYYIEYATALPTKELIKGNVTVVR